MRRWQPTRRRRSCRRWGTQMIDRVLICISRRQCLEVRQSFLSSLDWFYIQYFLSSSFTLRNGSSPEAVSAEVLCVLMGATGKAQMAISNDLRSTAGPETPLSLWIIERLDLLIDPNFKFVRSQAGSATIWRCLVRQLFHMAPATVFWSRRSLKPYIRKELHVRHSFRKGHPQVQQRHFDKCQGAKFLGSWRRRIRCPSRRVSSNSLFERDATRDVRRLLLQDPVYQTAASSRNPLSSHDTADVDVHSRRWDNNTQLGT